MREYIRYVLVCAEGEMCPDVPRCAPDVPGCAQMCPDVPKCAQVCPQTLPRIISEEGGSCSSVVAELD
jgi:hypothetical protein